jgi:hypothetical protein
MVTLGAAEVEQLLGAVAQMGGPGAVLGRLAGLSDAEQRARIPSWAWIAAALVAGGAAGVYWGPQIRERLENLSQELRGR